MFRIKSLLRIGTVVLLGAAALANAGQTGGASPSTTSPGFSCPPGTQWSVNTPIPSCVPSFGGTNSPIPCNGGTVNWASGPGVTCSGPVGAALNAATTAVSSTNGRTGSAQFTCTNGSWVVGAGATCVSGPCPAGTPSWTASGLTCQGNAGATAPGGATSVTSTNGNTGSAQFACDVTGAWSASPAPGATCAQQCPVQAVTWQVSGVTCNGSLARTPSGSTAAATSSSPNVGSSSWSCNSGAWTQSGSGTCAAASCPSGVGVYWRGATNLFCETYTQSSAQPGQSIAVSSTGANPGNATVTCLAGGTWGAPSGNCGAPASTACPSGAWVFWRGATNLFCETYIQSSAQPGQSIAVSSTGANQGSGTVSCQTGGTWGSASGSCGNTPLPAASCASRSFSWSQGGNTCSGNASNTSSGQSAYITDSTAPMTGTATAYCNNGSWGAASGSCSSTPAAVVSCNSQTLTWYQGTNACNAVAPSMPSGSIASLTDSVAPTTGTASATCMNGSWGPATGACNAAPTAPAGCSAQTLSSRGQSIVMPAVSATGTYTVTNFRPYINAQPSLGYLYTYGGPRTECGAIAITMRAACGAGGWGAVSWSEFFETQTGYLNMPPSTNDCFGTGGG